MNEGPEGSGNLSGAQIRTAGVPGAEPACQLRARVSAVATQILSFLKPDISFLRVFTS